MKRNETVILAAVLALAFGLRLLVALLPPLWNANAPLDPDSADYIALAKGLVDSFSYGSSQFEGLNRMPGYPLFLAIAMVPCKLLGVDGWQTLALLLQSLIDTCSCLLLWMILRFRLGCGEWAALFGMLLQALSALALVSCAKILSETLFTFLLLGTFWFLLPCLERKTELSSKIIYSAAFAGLLWGLACFTRVALLPLTPLAALALCLLPGRRIAKASAFLLPVALLIGCWSVRNGVAAGYWGTSIVSSINLYRYDAAAMEAKRSGRPFAEVQAEFDAKAPQGVRQAEYAAFCKREGSKAALAHPVSFVAVHIRGMVVSLLPGEGDLLKSFGCEIGGNGTLSVIMSEGFVAGLRRYLNGNWWAVPLALPSILLLLLKYALAAGFALDLRTVKERWLPLLVLAACAAWLLFAGGAAATPRFRAPVEPLLAIFASLAVAWLAAFCAKLRSMPFGNLWMTK